MMDVSDWICIFLVSITAAIILAYCHCKNAFKYWRRRGIAGPKPYLLVGNYTQTLTNQESYSNWKRRYGKVYGIYEGTVPVLVISDPKIMGQLCIKDFNIFPNHHDGPDKITELFKEFIFNTRDDRWRNMRAILSPTFTSIKMRRMFALFNICADNLLETMQERIKLGPVVNIKDLMSLYTLDAIASCCYGIRLNSYKRETSLTTAAKRDDFIGSAMKMFEFSRWRVLFINCIHRSILEWLGIGFIPAGLERGFAKKVEQIIKKRRESGKHFDDYLQTLIDSKLNSDCEHNLEAEQEHHADAGSKQSEPTEQQKSKLLLNKCKRLSEIEILANATFLIVVALDTTSTLLTNCVYVLGFHQTIQDKLYETIKTLAKIDDKGKSVFDYDSLTSCHYLDAIISETLRRHAVSHIADREANDDYYLKSHDLHIPKGAKVAFDFETIMMDPDNWTDPETFDPERFMPEQRHKIVPNLYCPFGIGQRYCMGMRFSLTESKLALAKLIMEYKFEPAPGTIYPPPITRAFTLNRMKRPEVLVTKRMT